MTKSRFIIKSVKWLIGEDMIKQNLCVKYNELQKELHFTNFAMYACCDGIVYYTHDGKSAGEKPIGELQTSGLKNKIVVKQFGKARANVIVFFYSQNIEKCAKLGGIPTVLDDYTEMFGKKLKVVKKDDKKVLRALSKAKNVIVDGSYCVALARSIDEAGTMARIIDKNAFVIGKCEGEYVKINRIVARGMNIGYTRYYSKGNQDRVWEREKTQPINTLKDDNIEVDDIKNSDRRIEALTTAKKVYQDNFTQGTWGNVSVRIDDKTLYCTPKAIGYGLLTPDDIVTMDFRTVEQVAGSTRATSEKGIHCRIMNEKKDAYVVVHAHPTYSSVFCAQNRVLEVSSEGRALLGDKVYCSKHAIPMTKRLSNNTVNAMNKKAVFMGNHGVAVYGESIDDVFNVLNTLEKEAKMALSHKKRQ